MYIRIEIILSYSKTKENECEGDEESEGLKKLIFFMFIYVYR